MARTSRFLAPLMILTLLLSSAALVLPSQQVLAAGEQWTVQMEFVTDPLHGQVIDPNPLEFGTNAASNDGIDGNDVAGGLQGLAPDDATAYFPNAAASPNDKLRVDYRAPLGATAGDIEVWQLSLIKDSGNASDMTLTWDDISGVVNFPLDASIVLSGGGQNINMRSTTTATYANGSNYTLTITVTRLGVPTEVWVDDDYCAPTATDGEVVGDGYIYGYNAFCDIQEGVDAVDAGATIDVANGNYSAFLVEDDDIEVLGEDGAVVSDSYLTNSLYYLAGIYGNGVVLQNLEFDGSLMPDCSDNLAAVYCYGVNDVQLTDLVIYSVLPCWTYTGYGIYVTSSGATVDIVDPEIYGCGVGIYVYEDTVNVSGGYIAGGYSSYCSTGIWAGYDSSVTVAGTQIYDHYNGGSSESEPELYTSTSRKGVGVYCDSESSVIVQDCCDIYNNDVGIFTWGSSAEAVSDEPVGGGPSYLTANGNNIDTNRYWGVFNYLGWQAQAGHSSSPEPHGTPPTDDDCENNWWGDASGPYTPDDDSDHQGLGNPVTLGVDYSPWLDGPCPNGDPVGMNAKLKGVARSGQPGLEVNFTDLSSPTPGCEIEEWLWNFGDGSTSSAQSPSHVYTREGTYTVTLTVVDSCGFKDSITMKAYISIKKSGGEALEPADMVVSYLLIDPLQVLPGQEVLVSGNVCNQGEERGTKTVSLMVNGVAEQSQTVGVSGGSCQQVSFRLSRAVPGTYQVAIDGMTGQFSVLAPRIVTNNVPSQQDSGLGTVGIVIIIALAVAIITALIFLFRK